MKKEEKLIFYGNIANNFVRMAEILSDLGFINVTVLIECGEDKTNLTTNNNTRLNRGYSVSQSSSWRLKNLLLNPCSLLRHKLNTGHVVFLSGTNLISALFIRKETKVIFFATGSDLTVFPFFIPHLKARVMKMYRIDQIIKTILLTWLMKLAFRRIDIVYAPPYAPFKMAIEKLKIERKVNSQYLPIVLRNETPISGGHLNTDLRLELERLSANHILIFCPARIMVQRSNWIVESGQYKGQDLLIEAFHMYLQKKRQTKILFLFIDREDCLVDSEILKKLISKYNLEDFFYWLHPKDKLYSRVEMNLIYQMVDVTFDQCGPGWFGSVSIEAMTNASPVICQVDEGIMRVLYDSHPFLSFQSIADLSKILERCDSELSWLRELGTRSKLWTEQNHGLKKISEIFLNL